MSRPRVHLALSAGLAALLFLKTRRALPSLAALTTGFLIDLDHLLDHLGPARSDGARRTPVVLALHGWELLAPIAAVEAFILKGRGGCGLALGYLLHLLVDQVANELRHPLTYSLAFRARRRFDPTLFGGKTGEHRWRREPLSDVWRWF